MANIIPAPRAPTQAPAAPDMPSLSCHILELGPCPGGLVDVTLVQGTLVAGLLAEGLMKLELQDETHKVPARYVV